MSMTKEQLKAVKARGRVLVSASAGSGKTTVMIKRLADILEEGASLDSVLAVTFTKKAAAQMKSRLRGELIARLDCQDGEKRENIRVQLGKINSADICTIHSFCARLVRTYFYVLGVNCAFEVLSDTDADILRSLAVNDLFARLYEEKDESFYLLLAKLRKKRSDESLKRLILSAYDEARKRPRYKKYFNKVCEDTFSPEGFKKVCAAYCREIAAKCKALSGAVERFEESFDISKNREGYLAVLDEMKKTLAMPAGMDSPFALPDRLFTSPKPKKYKNMPAQDVDADNAFMSFRDGVVKRYEALCAETDDIDVERERFLKSGELCRAFVSVLSRFDEAYDGVKREECKLDYGDLEQYALQLLTDKDEVTGAVRQINEKYKYVFVDEYQDVNPIQDEIIGAVAKDDLFCVGDVKQAIYGFRGSRSRFFLEKCGEDGIEHCVLPDNFRSAVNVIDFVNGVFSEVMKPPVCGLDYSDGHKMCGGARYPEDEKGVAEICIFCGGEREESGAEGIYSIVGQSSVARARSAEGEAVLQLVEEALKSKRYDPDKGCEVNIEAGDICVLTRKRQNDSANNIVRALSARYAVAGEAEANVCARPEIIKLLNVLSYLNNPEQDVPLVTALLSPLGGLSEEQLAKIRKFGGTGKDCPAFRRCVRKYAEQIKDETAEKLGVFFAAVSRLKALSECVGAARLIDEIVSCGGFCTEFDTEIKLGALRRLQSEAYTPSGELFLGAFLIRLKNCGYNLSAPSALAADCIRVMTMHASKGLEFPVVIVADIAASFKGDDKRDIMFDEEFGFALRYYGESDRTYRNTVLRRLIKARAEREDTDNEINLFYVACTRAGYALHVLCSDKKPYDFVRANFASSYSDLFDFKAFTHRVLPDYRAEDGQTARVKVLDISRADGEEINKIEKLKSAPYAHADVTDLPVKDSASHIISLRDGEEFRHTLFKEFEKSDKQAVIDRGVAYHRFLQLCDFSVKDSGRIREEISKMVYDGLLSLNQRELLKPDELEKILSMPVFDSRGREDFREREFFLKISSADYARLAAGQAAEFKDGDLSDGVIIQGAIDLLFVRREDGRAVGADVVDYKYSSLADEAVKVKYAPQLALYKRAVCAAYNLQPSCVTTTIVNLKRQTTVNIT